MSENHRIATPEGKHYPLPGPWPIGANVLSLDGKEAFKLTGGALCEYIGKVAYVTWPASEIPVADLDPNLTRARD